MTDLAEAERQYVSAMETFARMRGAFDTSEPVALLQSSAGAGFAPASERLATFHAMLASGPDGARHWDMAFEHLLRGAELGSVSLLILADPGHDPAIPPDPGADFWREVRSRISLERLLRSPGRTSLCASPRVRVIEGFASPAECRWAVDASRARMGRATIYDIETGEMVEDPVRDNSAAPLLFEDMDVVIEVLRTRISVATHVPVPVFEPAQILRYEVGQQFRPHHDYLDANSAGFRDHLAGFGQRIATFLIYLNDEFEGGETDFPAVKVRWRGRTGDAIFWANLDPSGNPDPNTIHAGLPPTSGEKWVFSQWIRERLPQPPA
jgi:prolyl 4-hydroxylase